MADSLTDLGLLMEDKGDYETAQPYLEQALAIRQEALGNKDAATAKSISFLGLVLWDGAITRRRGQKWKKPWQSSEKCCRQSIYKLRRL